MRRMLCVSLVSAVTRREGFGQAVLRANCLFLVTPLSGQRKITRNKFVENVLVRRPFTVSIALAAANLSLAARKMRRITIIILVGKRDLHFCHDTEL